jgi:hypothetical protein
VIVEDRERVQAVGVGEPAGAAGGYASDAPANVVAAAKFGFFRDEQAQEGPADVAEAYQGQVVEWNDVLPRNDLTSECVRYLMRSSGAKAPLARVFYAGAEAPAS